MTRQPDSTLTHLSQYWGYDAFRPLQEEAVNAVLSGRDSVVILPTGGGKSLCYQLPALQMEGMAIVVSPLISLMKDQVDQLRSRGIEADCINSSLTPREKNEVDQRIREGRIKLLYVAPERLLSEGFLAYLKRHPCSFFAIDEAHCISQWGHDFRPEYRALSRLRTEFPDLALHAYTATATRQVREDIIAQLGLRKPEVLVGSFDRPNLHYTVSRAGKKKEKLAHLFKLIDRHKGESGIVYCISRKNVEEIALTLNDNGYRALPYHAGMEDEPRRRTQEAFLNEEVDIIVATVAFGMGIDKTNVRFVAHWGLPKSIEHYQQESGRAGRDGLDSDCLLFYSVSDLMTWKNILRDLEPEHQKIAFSQLDEMESYCTTTRCRHEYLVGYFGQSLEEGGCQACDICLGAAEAVPDSLVISQKILSCVVRLNQRFGTNHTAEVLRGARTARILQFRHDQLSTYGLLSDANGTEVEDWIGQLLEQGYLGKDPDHKTLFVTEEGKELLRGARSPRLLRFEEATVEALVDDSWGGVDMELFKRLKDLRTRIAAEEKVPPYVVFSDATLRDMGRKRPSTHRSFRMVEGVGKKKSELYGELFLLRIKEYCEDHGVEQDVFTGRPPSRQIGKGVKLPPSRSRQAAFERFARGEDMDSIAGSIDRTKSTVLNYLIDYIDREQILDPTPWVDVVTQERIVRAIEKVGAERMRPIFEELNEEVGFDLIRIGAACWRNRQFALPT